MLFDRITLATAYEALKVAELNEGTLSNILFNKTAYYGTKTQIRFSTIEELRDYINLNFPFQMLYLNCQCGTCDEAMWQLLSFTVKLPTQRYVSFINNIRGEFESAEGEQLNKLSKDKLASVFSQNARLKLLLDTQECKEYIQNQGRYVNPCEYIEVELSLIHI